MSDTAIAPYTTETVDDFIVTSNTPDPAPEAPAAPRDERGRFASTKADAPADDAPADDETPDDEPPEAAKADPAPAKPPKRSLNRMIWEREEAQRKAQAAEARAAQLEAELQEARKPRPEPPRVESSSSAPRAAITPQGEKFSFDSFDTWSAQHPDATYEDYIEERAVARIEHKRTQEQREQQAREHADRVRAWGAAHQARELEARRLYPDYDQRLHEGTQALAAAGFPTLPPALGRAILESERSAQIAYDLGTHPEVALQLARESAGLPESAAPWVRRVLEGRLSAASSGSAEQPRTTSAKPVIKPVTGTPAATDPDDDGDDVPIEKWIATQNARDRKVGRW